jgi:ribosomal-protein-alanine N-acetyltransferase
MKTDVDMRVSLVRPSKKYAAEYLTAVARSRKLYRNLMTPIVTGPGFEKLVGHARSPRCSSFFVVLKDSPALVGAINIENIVGGFFQSATLGYYAFLPHAGKGLMREGLILVIDHAFKSLKLHRLEANIQPMNRRSIALVEGLGFGLEGLSPRFLKICGKWRDHERWALRAEDWQPGAVI